MKRKSNISKVTVALMMRDDVEVTAEVELEYTPPERGPDGIGTIPGGYSAALLSHDAPFGLTSEEERHIEETAIEAFDRTDEDYYDDERDDE